MSLGCYLKVMVFSMLGTGHPSRLILCHGRSLILVGIGI